MEMGYSIPIPTTSKRSLQKFISERAESVPFGHAQKPSRILILKAL